MTPGRASASDPTNNSRKTTPATLAAGVFNVWHRALNDAARAVATAASGVPGALRHGWSSLAGRLRSSVLRTAHATRRAATGSVAAVSAVPSGVFAMWHRLVASMMAATARSGRMVASVARSWTAQWSRVRTYHADPALAFDADLDADRKTAAAAGIGAFAFGVLIAGILASLPTGLPVPGLLTVASETLWAVARFVILALLVPRGAIDRARLSVAFLAGLLPYAIGATAALRIASLALSAVLTRRGLLGAGVNPRATNVAIGWSFGGQIGVLALGWLARFALALVAGA